MIVLILTIENSPIKRYNSSKDKGLMWVYTNTLTWELIGPVTWVYTNTLTWDTLTWELIGPVTWVYTNTLTWELNRYRRRTSDDDDDDDDTL